MKKRTIFLALLLAAVAPFAVGGTLFASGDSPDKQIKTALVDKLGADAQTIEVSFADGKAMLSGKVTEDSTQELAKEVALWVPGVTSVDSKIEAAKERMVGGGKLLAEREDMTTESGIKDAIRIHASGASALEVEACDGVVSVRGTVADKAQHDQVIDIATKYNKVKKVVDLLRVAG